MKTIEYDGLRFVRNDRTGYYLNSKTGKRLHRYVWEKYNGEIPKGYDVHHIDHDKNNNDISNLRMMTQCEHMRLHGSELTEEQKQRKRDNLTENARPKASEWHKSKEGIEWHKTHGRQVAEHMEEREYICENCGKTFSAKPFGKNRFCCNACKSAYRRKQNMDEEIRVCAYCGKEFLTNKYKKAIYCSTVCSNKGRCKKQSTP